MSILKLGSQIGQTVKNVGRLKTMLTVMGRHGLAEFAQRTQLVKLIPGFRLKSDKSREKLSLPERLKSAFEELGPTFVKLGQVLSTRPDLVPDDFVEEFKKLQDDVLPIDVHIIEKIIEHELKRPVHEIFKHFEKKPLAAASIAQVHEAILHNGTTVVVQVQRPGIEKLINTDISILFIIADLMDKYIEESRVFYPRGIVEEFSKSLKKELDFIVEAGNLTRIKKNFSENPNIVVPEVYREYSTHRVLTLEKLSGLRFSDRETLTNAGTDLKKIMHHGVQSFYQMVLIDGLFHADLHAGNILILDGDKLGLIDFGIVGRLNQKTRDTIGNMFLALITEDYDALVYEYLDIGVSMGTVNVEQFSKQIREWVEPYFGLPLKDVNVGRMLLELMVIASQNHLRMSQDLMLVCKALITIEGMGRSIDPDFDVLKEMGEFSQTLMKVRYDPERVSKDLLNMLRDSIRLFQLLPRQVKQILRKVSNDEWISKINIIGLEAFRERQMRGRQLISLSMLIATIILSSTLFVILDHQHFFYGVSVFGILGFGLAIILSFLYFILYFKK